MAEQFLWTAPFRAQSGNDGHISVIAPTLRDAINKIVSNRRSTIRVEEANDHPYPEDPNDFISDFQIEYRQGLSRNNAHVHVHHERMSENELIDYLERHLIKEYGGVFISDFI